MYPETRSNGSSVNQKQGHPQDMSLNMFLMCLSRLYLYIALNFRADVVVCGCHCIRVVQRDNEGEKVFVCDIESSFCYNRLLAKTQGLRSLP